MQSICFFNNKGGVGKTTLLCNVASYLSTEEQQQVLLVDADPQCNATQLTLDDKTIEGFYQSRRKPKDIANVTSLFDIMEPIVDGESEVRGDVQPIRRSQTRFGVDVLPGHPQMSLLEDRFSQAWLNLRGGEIGGARVSNWNTQFLRSISGQYDYVFFDVGPSLGALNRTVLLGCDYFVTPMGCDIFSLLGIKNISLWMNAWIKDYSDNIKRIQNRAIDKFALTRNLDLNSRFIGYTVQQYITKSKQGERRPTKAYEKIRKKIPETINKELGQLMRDGLTSSELALPDIPHMYSLVPLAQNARVPIHKVEGSDGLAGGQFGQRDAYIDFIRDLANSVMRNAQG